jgi:hypothetical protein
VVARNRCKLTLLEALELALISRNILKVQPHSELPYRQSAWPAVGLLSKTSQKTGLSEVTIQLQHCAHVHRTFSSGMRCKSTSKSETQA